MTKMRLNKLEAVLLTVAVVAVVCFASFLQGEMRRAARERNRHDVGTIVDAACANLSATELESNDSGRLQCGTVGREVVHEEVLPLTAAESGMAVGTQSR
jgi:hypothetical protein